jgi:hypothetical protein
MTVATKIMTEIMVGKEVTAGTAVTPVTRLICEGRVQERREEEPFEEDDNGLTARTARAPEHTKHWTEIELKQKFDFTQALLAFMAGMEGGIAGVGGAADKTWTFDRAANVAQLVDTFTFQYYESDGTNKIRKQAAYCFVTGFEIEIGADGVPMQTTRLTGRKATAPSNTAIAIPSLQSTASLLSKIYVDATWAGLGTTQILGQIFGTRYRYETGIFPQWYGDGRTALDFSTHHYKKRRAEVELDVAVEPNAGFVVAEETAREAKTARMVQIELLGPALGGGTYKLELDGAYYHAPDSMMEIGSERDGNLSRRVHLLSKYDATGALDVRAVLVNALTSFG